MCYRANKERRVVRKDGGRYAVCVRGIVILVKVAAATIVMIELGGDRIRLPNTGQHNRFVAHHKQLLHPVSYYTAAITIIQANKA